MRVLVTGANGFVGRETCRHLRELGYDVTAGLRRYIQPELVPELQGCERVVVGDLGPRTDWAEALARVDAVVHLAAMTPGGSRPRGAKLEDANVDGARGLAAQAGAAGVRRFLFVSTARVHASGDETPLTENSPPAPEDAYARSKWQAELAVRAALTGADAALTVIRPPLVYGPGAKGNFLLLLRAVFSGWPLPLAGVESRRSLVARANLVDFFVRCLEHPGAAGETFLVSDDEDLALPELIRRIGRALGRPPWLLTLPRAWLPPLACLVGRGKAMARLLRGCVVDGTKARRRLNWTPPVTMHAELDRTAAWFRQTRKGRA